MHIFSENIFSKARRKQLFYTKKSNNEQSKQTIDRRAIQSTTPQKQTSKQNVNTHTHTQTHTQTNKYRKVVNMTYMF